jgi:hypothetical protein
MACKIDLAKSQNLGNGTRLTMIQTVIIALPACAALIVCLLRGPKQALLNIYLPTLLLLPHGFWWPISGQFTFSDPVILIIFFFFLFQPQNEWHWSVTDFLVMAYLAITVISTGINGGYKLGQNLALKELCTIFLPYYIAKQTMSSQRFAIEVAKRIVALLSVVAIVSVYELRMGKDLFLVPFSAFFSYGMTVVFRGGLMRTQGPFGHAMAQGFMMAVGYPIARWLDSKEIWHDKLPFLGISKIRFCELSIVAGLLMTISLGDWIGGAVGAIALFAFRARYRKAVLALVILCAVVLGPPIWSRFSAYVSTTMDRVSDQTQQDVVYRNMLLQEYIPIVEERPTWGWGMQYPVINGMFSIDNGYLFTAIVFGVYALGLWVALLLWTLLRLVALAFRLPRDHPGASAAASLAAIYLIIAFCNTEGALPAGPQIGVFFFLVTGWSAALLTSNELAEKDTSVVSLPRARFAFRRVMA